MANRSDFFDAKLPRYLKKMLALAEFSGAHSSAQAKEVRKLFINAHATHVGFKLKRNVADNRDAATGE